MASLVSIIIPTYNRAVDLERALGSVLAQNYSDWEALVVDNHSTDGTDALVEKINDPRISFLQIHNEGIIAASRNLGIANARGEFIAFLDSDDWWMREKLERSVEALQNGADVVYHDLHLVRRETQKRYATGGSVRKLGPSVFEDLLANGNALANSGVVIRTAILGKSGPLSENRDLVGMEDFDTWLRIAQHTDRFIMLPDVLGYYWAGGGNLTNPEGSLRALKALETHYEAELASLDKGSNPVWLMYSRGRALFQLGRYFQARAELGRLTLSELPPRLALKVCYMLVRSSIVAWTQLSALDRGNHSG